MKSTKTSFLILFLFIPILIINRPFPISAGARTDGDDEFLEKIAGDSFKFFWEEANPGNGLIPDSSRTGSPCSIATVGFGLTALCIGAERGWITKPQAYDRIIKTLKYFYEKVPAVHGFYYHFLDMEDGRRVWNSELSSIDTAIFIAGALTCAEFFKGTEIEEVANKIYERVDWPWMLNGREVLCMGWKPDAGFLPYYWDTLSELMILYALAIGSPTHPIPPSSWDAWKRPSGKYGEHIFYYCTTGSLFVYQYSHAWIDFKSVRDKYADYWENSVQATLANRQFCIDNTDRFIGYTEYSWGLTACIGPDGYKGYGGGPGNPYHDGTIAPSAAAGSLPFTPEISIRTLKTIRAILGKRIYGKYGFLNSFNLDRDWVSNEYLGIDTGITVLMIENYRSGFVWKYFMNHTAIKKWISLCMISSESGKYIEAKEEKSLKQ